MVQLTGTPVCDTVELLNRKSDLREILGKITSVIDLLEEGIKNTQDAAIVEELKKARKQVVAAKNAFWKASNLLRETGF